MRPQDRQPSWPWKPGSFGADTSQPQFYLYVSSNHVGPVTVVSAGVHNPETLQALLGDSQRAKGALALPAI
jgi:hypothetical protein